MEETVSEQDIEGKKCHKKDYNSDRYLDLIAGIIETESECVLDSRGKQFIRIISSKRRYPVEADIEMTSPNDCIGFENDGCTHKDSVTIAPATVGSDSNVEKDYDIELNSQSSMDTETMSVKINYKYGSNSSLRSGPRVSPKIDLSNDG
jgi:hypothetical protein